MMCTIHMMSIQLYLFVFVKTSRQEKQQRVNQLAKVTDKCMKDFSALPVTTEQVQLSHCPTEKRKLEEYVHYLLSF